MRKRRRSLYSELGDDPDRLLAAIRELQNTHPEKVVDRRKAAVDRSGS